MNRLAKEKERMNDLFENKRGIAITLKNMIIIHNNMNPICLSGCQEEHNKSLLFLIKKIECYERALNY